MQQSSRAIIQSVGAFLNEDKLFLVTSYTASSEINLSCCLRCDNIVMTEAYSHHEYIVVDGIHYAVFR